MGFYLIYSCCILDTNSVVDGANEFTKKVRSPTGLVSSVIQDKADVAFTATPFPFATLFEMIYFMCTVIAYLHRSGAV